MPPILEVKKFIDYLHEVSQDSSFTFPRYPLGTKKNQMFYVSAITPVEIDMELFKNELIKTYQYLEIVDDILYYQVGKKDKVINLDKNCQI
ncbi:MAG: hypothetical protein HUJ96_06000 [Marinilabiliaceae bacterium]|nr:hypothetical protein [Marinilabiliaceae bacterium]